MRSAEEIKSLLDGVLRSVSADDAVASYGGGGGHATRFGENAITQNMGGEQERLSLGVAFGTRHGGSSTTRVTEEAMVELVRRAEANAAASPEDPEYVPPPGPQQYPETQPRYFDGVNRMTPMKLAEDVAGAIDLVRTGGYCASGFFQYGYGCGGLANSKGLFACDQTSNVGYSMTAHGPVGCGSASRSEEAPDRVDAAALAREALATAKAAQDPRDIEPGDYTVVFEPRAVSDLLGSLLRSMDARGADEGSTAFAGKLGERIAGEKVTLSTVIDSALLPAAPFGNAGLASRPMTWIRNGILERLQHDRYWAAKKGTEPDPVLLPVFMEGEDRSHDELVAQCADGLLVKRLWYIRFVDRKQLLLTGMTRDGLFRIENGRISYPVKNLRFNESPLVFLQNVIAMSRPERVGNAVVVPGVMSEAFTFSSKTESV